MFKMIILTFIEGALDINIVNTAIVCICVSGITAIVSLLIAGVAAGLVGGFRR
jgi:hypothetical protein